jgi:diacylglycerol kinase family enzyme
MTNKSFAHVIVNPHARGVQGLAYPTITDQLHQHGYHPILHITSQEQDIDRAFETIHDGIVVVIGGDGTVYEIAKRLLTTSLPLLILPAGTANNIARYLRLPANPLDVLKAVPTLHPVPFDVGEVTFPWGKDYFLEGMGFGLMADIFHDYGPHDEKNLFRGIAAALENITNPPAYSGRLQINGTLIRNDFLTLEIMNINALGPRIQFEPDASASDGKLNVLMVTTSEATTLQALGLYLLDQLPQLPEFIQKEVAETILLEWQKIPYHLDGRVITPPSYPLPMAKNTFPVTVSVLKGALQVLA